MKAAMVAMACSDVSIRVAMGYLRSCAFTPVEASRTVEERSINCPERVQSLEVREMA